MMLTAALALALQGPDLTKMPALDATNSVPFAPPYDDAPDGSAFDASFLNVKPAGKNGRLVAKDGHFVEERTGKRVNLFGTNVGARAAFPQKAEADKIAGRLAKMGVNVIRLHHLQNGWDPEGMVWKRDKIYLEIDPEALDRMDFFVAALVKRGIYVNLNLHTARVYQPELGFPEVVKTMGFGKRVDKFNRRMIELQKQYAKDVLDRTNPYLKTKYKDEPGLAIVEINNENSLVGAPWEGIGAGLSNLPEPFNTELRALWQSWLKKTYRDDAALAKAWTETGTIAETSVVGPSNAWTTENQSNGKATYTPVASAGQTPTLVTEIADNPGADWHMQAHLGGLTLENGKLYTVTFRAKGSQAATIGVSAMRDRADWHNVGLQSSVALTTEFKEYAYSFRATDAEAGASRVGFVLGAARGRIEIADLRVREGRIGGRLPAGQSLGQGNVDIPAVDGTPAGFAWLDFLTETETAYAEEMMAYLRRDLGFGKTNLIDSQGSWGGLTSVSRERQSAYADDHQYWQHPNFVGGEWNPKNYTVGRAAISSNLPDFATLGNLAVWRRYDRPFSVSEYDHPAPNDFVAEMMPLFSTFAAHQGWDALYTFAWEHTAKGAANDRFEGYFDQARNPAKIAFYPLSAIIFRQGLIPPPAYRQTLVIPKDRPWVTGSSPWAHWGLAKAKPDMVGGQVGFDPRGTTGESVVLANRAAPGRSVTILEGTGGKIYRAASDRALAVTGFTNGRRVLFEGGYIEFGNVTAGLSATMLAPLDGKPLVSSSRLLLASVGRAENVGMAWNEARNSVSDQWGQGPARAEVVPMTVSLRPDGPRKVYRLDATGKRLGVVPTKMFGETLRFSVGKENMGVLFEIAK